MNVDQLFPHFPVLFFLVVWAGVCFLIARIGGWSELGAAYRTSNPFPRDCFSFVSVGMRGMTNYGHCVTLGADAAGVYLKTIFLFRVFHPPLFIPWVDLSVQEEKIWFARCVTFRTARAPGAYFFLRAKTAAKILQFKPAGAAGFGGGNG